MSFDPAGKLVMVTGATRGLGWAVARALGAAGAQVIAVARTVGALEELDDAIRQSGGPSATLVPLDLTDQPGIDRMGAALYQRFGHLDLLVHCAGQSAALSPVAHIAGKDLDRVLNINLRGTWALIRSLDGLLRLAPGGGRALLATDTTLGTAFWGAYGASRLGADQLIRAWAQESTAHIRVARFAPPIMPTALRARMMPGLDPATLPTTAEIANRLLNRLRADDWVADDLIEL